MPLKSDIVGYNLYQNQDVKEQKTETSKAKENGNIYTSNKTLVLDHQAAVKKEEVKNQSAPEPAISAITPSIPPVAYEPALPTYSAHGNITSLQISFKALIWGMLSALSVVFYTVQPEKLLEKYGPPTVVAWGMIIGGIAITFVTKPWNIDVIFDFTTFFVLILIILFGTITAFILYLTGVNIIGPTKASIIACIEPVAATICAILFLGVNFGFLDLLGFICIISTIFIVAYFDRKTKKK